MAARRRGTGGGKGGFRRRRGPNAQAPRMGGAVPLWVYYTAQDDPKKNTAKKLAKKNLANIIEDPKKIPAHAVLLNPYAKKALSAEDLPQMQKRGLVALDCSWKQAEEMFPLLQGKVRSRALPYLLAASPVNYAKPFRLTTAEAMAAGLWIAGEKAQARRVLGAVGFGDQFLALNREPLDEYAACSTSREVVEIQMEYLDGEEEE